MRYLILTQKRWNVIGRGFYEKDFRVPDVHNLPGAGVGLYLTRQILEAQGCYVTMSSVPGEGSTFTIRFL